MILKDRPRFHYIITVHLSEIANYFVIVSERSYLIQRRSNIAVKLTRNEHDSEEVGHGLKGIMVGRICESRTLFYRGHEINMAGFLEEVSINIDHHFYLPVFSFAISNPQNKFELVLG